MRLILCSAVLFSLATVSFAQVRMSDAAFDGFKGRVKKVRTYDSDIEVKNRKTVVTPRKLQDEEEYDENGNLKVSIFHTMGDKRVFTIIDGEKTSKNERFHVPGLTVITGVPLGEQPPKSVVRDPRFTTKYKYEYDDQGRIIDERRYGNDGKLHTHWKYEYDAKGNLVEEVTLRGEKITDEKTLNVFDSAGNLVESRLNDGPISEDSVTTYRYSGYKFDAGRNWIERTQTTIYYKDGNRVQLKSITYREITYFN